MPNRAYRANSWSVLTQLCVVLSSCRQWAGSRHSPTVQISAAIYDHGFTCVPFCSDAVDQTLECIKKANESPIDTSNRLDLRDLNVLSIDPLDCTDRDDALHIRAVGDDVYEVGVHIADVIHYVPHGSALDREASTRACKLYTELGAICMLPEVLLTQVLSLEEGVDRYVIVLRLCVAALTCCCA